MKVNKKLTNLYISEDIVNYFTDKAREELEDEDITINQVSLQRRRARLMVDILTEYYNSDEERLEI